MAIWRVMCSQAAIDYDRYNSRDSNKILRSDKDHVLIMSCALGQSLLSIIVLLYL